MNKVSMDKKYRTRSGLPVRVICVDRKAIVWTVIGLIELPEGEERYCFYTQNGRANDIIESEFDLVEVTQYDDFKIDDKVLVSLAYTGGHQCKRHFAGVDEDGYPLTFADGLTSWSTNGNVTRWDFCKKADE